jgi:RNA polymerase sigma-70 factor (ECF subfamily)
MDLSTYAPDPQQWAEALAGDRDAFEACVAPLQDFVLRAAHRQVAVERELGRLRVDHLTPEELYGETLVRAWDGRAGFEGGALSFRGWLLGLQHRALVRLGADERRYEDRKAISLDEEVPTNAAQDHVEETMYEFRDPLDVVTYEELIPGSNPDDVELDMSERNGRMGAAEQAFVQGTDLDPSPRIALFHGEFEIPMEEVQQILSDQLNDMAEDYNLARTPLRERIGSTEDFADNDPKVDSYTGDPLPDA